MYHHSTNGHSSSSSCKKRVDLIFKSFDIYVLRKVFRHSPKMVEKEGKKLVMIIA